MFKIQVSPIWWCEMFKYQAQKTTSQNDTKQLNNLRFPAAWQKELQGGKGLGGALMNPGLIWTAQKKTLSPICKVDLHFLQFVRLISKHRPAVLGSQKITKNTCPKLVAFIVPWIFVLCDSDSLQAVFVKAVAGAEENADGAAQQRQYRSQRRDGLQSPRSCQWAATVWICSTWKDEVCIAPLNKKLAKSTFCWTVCSRIIYIHHGIQLPMYSYVFYIFIVDMDFFILHVFPNVHY